MDSSGSDSDEFYECDDYEDAKKPTETDVRSAEVANNQISKNTDIQVEGPVKQKKAPLKSPEVDESQVNNNKNKEDNLGKSGEENDNVQKNNNEGRPEFGIPPTKVTCWFPEVEKLKKLAMETLENIENKSSLQRSVDVVEQESKSQVIIKHEEGQEKEDTIESDSRDDNDNQTASQLPQESIITETKSVKLDNEKREEKDHVIPDKKDDNEWEDDGWDEINNTPNPQLTIKPITETPEQLKKIVKKRLDKRSSPSQLPKFESASEPNPEEHFWEDNDDWGKPPEEDKTVKATPLQLKTVKKRLDKPSPPSQLPKLEPTSKTNPVENLWEDNDDWSKPQEEDNLWGDGDGWEIDQSPTKLSKTPETQTDAKPVENEEEDMWAVGDNWGIDEAKPSSNTSNPPKPSKSLEAAFSSLTTKEESSWGGWGNWSSGISSVLSTAATLTTSVSQGLTNVLETGMGVPDPAELARLHKEEEKLIVEDSAEESTRTEGDNSLFSTITKLVETTGTKVISGGLGTLETIGKKTYQVLQENDPQLKKKRAFLKQLEGDKPVLSAMLREAKERAEDENRERELRHFAKKAHYETMFDDFQGLVHLEALEMLSKQCDIKLQTILSQCDDVTEMQETMEQVKDLCELTAEEEEEENFDDLKEKIQTAIGDINVPISCNRLLDTFVEIRSWVQKTESENSVEIHSSGIENLAKITAMAVEQYHKAGELLLVKDHRSTADEADSLVQLTTALSALITILSTDYSEKLKLLATEASNNDDIKGFISNIFLEAANSSRYIEDAFQLLIPVIQVGAV